MTIKNHKNTEAEIVVIYSNGYGDNLKLLWKNNYVDL